MSKSRVLGALCIFILAAFSTPSSASLVTWDFSGEITSAGVFSDFTVNESWSLSISFDSAQTGTASGFNTTYVGDATFSSLSYGASDTTTQIIIADAPNQLQIFMSPPDAVLPDLNYNVGGTGTPSDLQVNLSFDGSGPGTEDLGDYLNLSSFTLSSTSMVVRVPSSASPTGVVNEITASPAAIVPIPGAVWLFGSGLLGLVRISRRKKVA